MINPLIVKLTVLIQDICIEKYHWDDQLSENLVYVLQKLLMILIILIVLFFKRKYCFTSIDDPVVNIPLHGFSDASLRANECCVIYVLSTKVVLLNVTWFQTNQG